MGGCNKIKCPRIRAPVCASDGQSYNNECLVKVQACLNKKKLLVKQYGLDQNDESGSQEPGKMLHSFVSGSHFVVRSNYRPIIPFPGWFLLLSAGKSS